MWGYGSSQRQDQGGKRYNNDMVAHVWAAGSESAGQSGNGNFYFHGRTLYSYGSHFVVGFRFSDTVVILNSDSYGPSTSQHQSLARSAARHMTQIRMPLDSHRASALARFVDKIPSEVHKPFRTEVAKWIAAPDGPDLDNATRLLALCYPPSADPAGRAARLIEKRNRAIKRQAAENKAAERQRDLRTASRVVAAAEKNAADMQTAPRYELERASKRFHRLHRVAKSAGRTRQAAVLWRLYRQSRDLMSDADERARVREIRSALRVQIRRFREGIAKHAAGTARAVDYRNICFAAEQILLASGRVKDRRLRHSLAAAQHVARVHCERLNAIEAAERIERERERREEWLAGRGTYWRGSDAAGMAYIRAVNVQRDSDGRIMGGDLETSHGAAVPLTHAIRAFPLIRRCRDNGTPWSRNGSTIRVGHFQIDRIDSDGSFTAGCHRIGWTEVERLARELGVFESTAEECRAAAVAIEESTS